MLKSDGLKSDEVISDSVMSDSAEPAQKLRVLISAEACNPEWASVPLEGWSHAMALMRLTQSHLVTQIRNQGALERAGLVLGKDFSVIDSERLAKPIYKLATWLRGAEGKGWTVVTALSSLIYPYYEWLMWRAWGKAIRAHQFDVVYRITPLSPTAPSLLAQRCARAGVPFVLGPLNGGIPWPRAFDAARRAENEWLSYVRACYKWLPSYRATRDFAAAIIVGSQDTLKLEPQRYHAKCIYIPENGIDLARFTFRRLHTCAVPLRLVFVGRLVPYKGADMLIEAAAPLLRTGQVHLTIIGDGPQRYILEKLILNLGLSTYVEMAGWVPHHTLQDLLITMDLLAFPSIREFGGAVVLEAMALGLVPAVVNYGGPSELVTPETGFLIPMASRNEIIERFKCLFAQLVQQPALIESRSALAYARARDLFSWDAKASQVVQVLKWVAGQGSKPDFQPTHAAEKAIKKKQSPSLTGLFVSISQAALSIHPEPGLIGFKRRARLWIAALIHLSALIHFFDRISALTFQRIALNEVDVIGMSEWPYINNTWTVKERLDKKAMHYEIIAKHYPVLLNFVSVLPALFLDLSSYSEGFRLVFDRPDWFKREGEMVLNIFKGEIRVSSAAFTFGYEADMMIVYIGAMQGMAPSISSEERSLIYKKMTHDFYGLSSRSLLLSALQMIVSCLKFSCLLGVSEEHRHHRHPFFGPFDRRLSVTDYDQQWIEFDGVLDEINGFYKIPTHYHQKSAKDIPVRKRALYERRYQLLKQLDLAVARRLGVCTDAN
jgi:glycosyltransferase involved in cell wall biosynthesis